MNPYAVAHSPFYLAVDGRGRRKKLSTAFPAIYSRSKYGRVKRSLPYPSRGEKGCKWKFRITERGRKVWEPIA